MTAVVVFPANGCIYCQAHHGVALNVYWKDEERAKQLRSDYHKAGLTAKEMAMCDFAIHLTKNPAAHEENN